MKPSSQALISQYNPCNCILMEESITQIIEQKKIKAKNSFYRFKFGDRSGTRDYFGRSQYKVTA